jgi:hypothetical protein
VVNDLLPRLKEFDVDEVNPLYPIPLYPEIPE